LARAGPAVGMAPLDGVADDHRRGQIVERAAELKAASYGPVLAAREGQGLVTSLWRFACSLGG
jgi:hypothetical protein